MSAISSLLKTGLKELPDNTVVPAQSVPNLLKKKGIKDEEIQFSGVELPKEGKVTKADLVKMEEGRKDVFSTEYANSYNWVSLKPGRNNPTYKEKITTYSEKGAKPADSSRGRLAGETNPPGSRYTSDHFEGVPNYLMHTRIYDDTIDGTPTRVVTEIQSDLHQAGRQQGYSDGPNPKIIAAFEKAKRLSIDAEDTYDEDVAEDLAEQAAQAIQELQRLIPDNDFVADLAFEDFKYSPMSEILGSDGAYIPKSPFEKTWLRKGLEREVADAIEEGRGQIAIPISGDLQDLQRAPGVQKWYETNVVSTAKKLAKSSGMDFELKTVGKGITQQDLDNATSAYHLLRDGDIGPMEEAIAKLPDGVREQVVEMLDAGLPLRNLRYNLQENIGNEVTYAVIKPKGEIGGLNISSEQIDKAFVGDEPLVELRKMFDVEQLTSAMADTNHYLISKAIREDPEALKAGLMRVVNEAKHFTPTTKPSFALYASPAATAFVAYQALSEGMSQDDVETMLSEDGYDQLEIDDILANTQAIATMKAEGYSDEDIKPMLEEQEVDLGESTTEPLGEPEPMDDNRISNAYRDIMGAVDMTIKELVAKMETVYPDDSYVTTNIAGFFGDKEAQRVSDESRMAQRKRIISEANSKYDLALEFGTDGEWYAQTENGTVMVTPEWWRGFTENKLEMVGGFAGAYAGFKAGSVVAANTPGHPLMKLGAGFLTAVGVTAVGASLGTELDYMHSALMIQQDFEASAMARKAMTSAELSVIGDAVGGGVIKVAGASWRGVKTATDYVRKGMFDRAGTALKETFFLTDDEAAEIVTNLSRVAKVEGKTPTERAIAATAVTKPGAEELVQASVHSDPRASRAVVKAIDDRAKDLLTSTSKLEGEDVGRFIREDFEGYRTLVREGYERAKVQAASAPNANAFSFNYDKMAINPVLTRLGKNIENKDLAFKFGRQAQKIRDMSKSRRLPDLIELRKLVNEFRYNKRISNAKDYDMLDQIKAGIDRSIELGADITMENPKEWLSTWRTANKQYSEMKSLEKNVLAKVIGRPGVSEKAIGQALTKYATALDSTFVEVVAQLPKKSAMRAEGAVMNNLAQKFTAGAVDGVKATNFPGLADELKAVNFRSPEARSMKKAINELANVFKNDVPLSSSAGGIQVTQFAQALTTDPVMKAKYALASHMFHYVRAMAPGKQGRASALITKTAKLLEEPMNSKTIKELQTMLDGEVNLDVELEELIKQAAQQRADGTGMPRVKLYGDGKVLTGKGSGTAQSIPVHHIAKTEEVKAISEATGINMADKKALDQALRDRGYSAAQLGADKVRLLND